MNKTINLAAAGHSFIEESFTWVRCKQLTHWLLWKCHYTVRPKFPLRPGGG